MRRERKYHYIYKTTCTVTDKFYIGMHSTDNLEDGYIGSGKRLWHSIRKHGIENHVREILEFLPNRSSLKSREKEIVNEVFLQDPMCMNLQLGGGGGWASDDHRLRNLAAMSKAGNEKLKELWNDQSWSDVQKEKRKAIWKNPSIREKMLKGLDWTGRTHSEETKRKIGETNSTTQKGENNSQHGTCWITNGTENKKIKKTDDLPEGWSYGRKIKTHHK